MTPDINQILGRNPRSCSRGAPLGDTNFRDSEAPLYLQRVRLIDGDYGKDGTYWGASPTGHVWCACNGEDYEFAPAMGTRIYVRAKTREEAKAEVLRLYPDAKVK